MDLNAVESGAMASQDRVTLALLPLLTFAPATGLRVAKLGEKANT